MTQLYQFSIKYSSVILVLSLFGIIATDDDRYQSIKFDLNDAPKLFEDFVKKYNKAYLNEKDREEHYEAFKRGLQFLNDYNLIYELPLVIDEFMDLTQKEIEILRNLDKEVNESKWFDHRIFYDAGEFPHLFERFIKIYKRDYKNDEEKNMRFECFQKRLERLNHFNQYWSAPRQFVDETYDFTEEELVKYWETKYPGLKDKEKLKSSNKGVVLAPPRLYKKPRYETELKKIYELYEELLKDHKLLPIPIDNEEKKKERFEIFKENVQLINELNENFVAPFTVTKAALLTRKERNEERQKEKNHRKKKPPSAPLPDLSETQPKKLYDLQDIVELFDDYIQRFSVVYETEEQKQEAFQEFKENVKHLNWLNEYFSGTFVINKFTGYTSDELNDFVIVSGPKPDTNEKNKLKPGKEKHKVYTHWQKK